MKWLLLVICLFCLLSCNPNWGDYGGYRMDYRTTLQYYINLDKGSELNGLETKEVALRKGTLVKFIRASGKIDTVLIGRGAFVIESFVDKANIAFNKRFILVDQKPLSLIPFCGGGNGGGKECEEALKRIDIHQYWIIDKPQDYIYGPLTAQQFLIKRKDLKVPDVLNIKLNNGF